MRVFESRGGNTTVCWVLPDSGSPYWADMKTGAFHGYSNLTKESFDKEIFPPWLYSHYPGLAVPEGL